MYLLSPELSDNYDDRNLNGHTPEIRDVRECPCNFPDVSRSTFEHYDCGTSTSSSCSRIPQSQSFVQRPPCTHLRSCWSHCWYPPRFLSLGSILHTQRLRPRHPHSADLSAVVFICPTTPRLYFLPPRSLDLNLEDFIGSALSGI